ncbi:MAG: glutamate--tRNA ligase [Deltaproteobacteria bacterium]|nr:glutamate--tRNA ligase [Deltaproteobacteria bacterium]
MGKRRYRYAPSPTGVLHVGNARTAIYNWLLARHYESTLILRIEDTDKERSTPESEKAILQDLKWLGLDWDEGPDKGGDCGPYRQSERGHLYEEYQHILLQKKRAYYCFCTPEELKQQREELLSQSLMPQYTGRCLKYSESQVKIFLNQNKPYVVRYHVLPGDPVIVHDQVRGDVKFERETIGDFVIAKSDGGATYQFACVVDDALMKVTHVVRGDDHLSNTPKQLLIFEDLGFKPPVYAHLPMVLGIDRKKLSKRHGAVSVGEYKEKGYLPHAFLNFLVLLGWSSETEDELLEKERLIKEFTEKRLSRSPSIFETGKLDWMNGQYIRKLSLEEFYQSELSFIEKEYDLKRMDIKWLKQVLAVLQTAVVKLPDICKELEIFFEDRFHLSPEVKKEFQNEDFKKVLIGLKEFLEKSETSDFEVIKKSVSEQTGAKGKNLFMPLRLAITGQKHGPELSLVVPLLGYKNLKKRIEHTMKELGL